MHGRVVLTFLWHGMVRMERQLHERSCPAGITPAFVPRTRRRGIEGSRHELTKIYRRAKYYRVGTVKRAIRGAEHRISSLTILSVISAHTPSRLSDEFHDVSHSIGGYDADTNTRDKD